MLTNSMCDITEAWCIKGCISSSLQLGKGNNIKKSANFVSSKKIASKHQANPQTVSKLLKWGDIITYVYFLKKTVKMLSRNVKRQS